MRLTIREAAAHCGYKSATVLYCLQQSGLLRDCEAGRCGRSLLLESNPPGRCSLRGHIAACVQLRHDSPLAQRPHRAAAAFPLADLSDAELGAHCDQLMAGLDAAVPELGPDGPDWERVAERLNGFLGCTWPASPWDGDQVAAVALCLKMSKECD
jgi:hypothetical protein